VLKFELKPLLKMSTKIVELKENFVPKRRNRNRNKNKRKQTIQTGKKAMEIMLGRKNGPQSKQARRRRRQNNGGQIDRFPSGNKQGQNFRSGKISNEIDMEYIGEIKSTSTSFVINQTLACNPGQASVFPWLSKKALLYEKYQFKSLEFIYKPQVSQFANLGTTGKVILSFDYDSSDAPPSSKQQAEDTDPSADGLPYERLSLKMNPRELHKNSDAKFIRPAGLPGGSDIKTYDCGVLTVSTSALENGGGYTIGELWVRYNCVLSVPVLESVNVAPTNYFVTSLQDTSAAITTNSAYQPLLNAVAGLTVVNVNGIGVVNTAGSIVPPPGNYIYSVQSEFVCSGAYLTECSLSLSKNAYLQGPVSEVLSSALLATVYTCNLNGYISCDGTDAITLSCLAVFATGTCAVTTVFMLTAI
jgi:hypothetical protein